MSGTYNVGPDDEVLRVSFDEPLNETMIPHVKANFITHLEQGVRHIIVDRRNGTNLNADKALQFGSEMGAICARYQAKVAVIVKEDDIMEYIVCGGALVVGRSNMITTGSEREAEQWITGQVR